MAKSKNESNNKNSGTKYGDDSGFQGYYDNNTKKDNNNVRKD